MGFFYRIDQIIGFFGFHFIIYSWDLMQMVMDHRKSSNIGQLKHILLTDTKVVAKNVVHNITFVIERFKSIK
jgi:hypothetical protein